MNKMSELGQKLIIKKGRSVGANVFVATNLLESMLVNRKPTRSELNDVMNTYFYHSSHIKYVFYPKIFATKAHLVLSDL